MFITENDISNHVTSAQCRSFVDIDTPTPVNVDAAGASSSRSHTEETVEHNATNGSVPNNEDSKNDFRCGWFNWKPSCVQVCNRPPCLLFFMGMCAIAQGLLINGFIASSIQTIEKRYELSSSKSGIISSMYDIGELALVYSLFDYYLPSV